MLATLHRVGPLAGLTVALVATVGWIGLLATWQLNYFETEARFTLRAIEGQSPNGIRLKNRLGVQLQGFATWAT